MRKRQRLAAIFLTLLSCFMLSLPRHAWAQNADQNASSPLEARQAVGTILVSGLVGGILGLSTLSFYKNPQDNIRNITIGAGAGALLAVVYLTVNVATTPLNLNDNQNAGLRYYVVPDYQLGRVGVSGGLRF